MIFTIVLALVAAQRVAEVIYAERNARRLLSCGAVEVAPDQHAWFVALHAAWLLTMLLFIPRATKPNWWLLAIFFVLQIMRIWIIRTLGERWTTRIVTVPNAPLVRTGPYRWFKHPNYAIVVCEIAILPLAFGAWRIAIGFTILNAALLTWRIRTEDRVLEQRMSEQSERYGVP